MHVVVGYWLGSYIALPLINTLYDQALCTLPLCLSEEGRSPPTSLSE